MAKSSGETVTLGVLGARLLALNTDMRDLRQRFGVIEARFGALETRFSGLETRFGTLEARFTGLETRAGVLEEHLTRLISLVVCIAERIGAPAE